MRYIPHIAPFVQGLIDTQAGDGRKKETVVSWECNALQ